MPRIVQRDFGTSLFFPGSGSVVKTAATNLPAINGNFSMLVWVKLNQFTSTQSILGIYNTGASAQATLQVRNGFFGLYGFGGVQIVASPTLPTSMAKTWLCLGYTSDGVTNRLYLNGIQVASTTTAASSAVANVVRVSTFNGVSEAVTGYVDAACVWNRTLSAQEISDSYYVARVDTGLVLNWKFNEGSGTTAIDSSSSANSGTISGATYSTDVAYKIRLANQQRQVPRNFNAAWNTQNASNGGSFNLNTDGWTGFAASFWIKQVSIFAVDTIDRAGAFTDRIVQYKSDSTMRFALAKAATNIDITTTKKYPLGLWHHVVCTYDGVNAAIYVDGALDYSFPYTGPLLSGNVNPWFITNGGSHNNTISALRIWNRGLSAQEVTDIYTTGMASSNGLQFHAQFNDGAGAIAYDASGNGNNVTLNTVVGSYVTDVPYMRRAPINRNLIVNGDFEFAPPAATNVLSGGAVNFGPAGKYLDGTANGSSTNPIFGWHAHSGGASQAGFDYTVKYKGNCSLKLSTLGTGQYAEVSFNYPDAKAIERYNGTSFIPVLPSTPYTLTYWLKTNYVSGDSNNGAFINIMQSTGQGVATNATASPAVKTTTDWTQYTVNFTTSGTAAFINPQLRIYGHTGTATLVMDAWFDDVILMPTTPTSRTLIS